jgi:hypothetical protein
LVVVSDYFLGNHEPLSRGSMVSLARAVGLLAMTMIVALLPWSILQYQSSGTFFYPLGHSNVTEGFTLLMKPQNLAEEGTQLIEHFFYDKPVAIFLPFAIAGLLPQSGSARNDLPAFSIATLLGVAAFSHQAVAWGPANAARYFYASVAAMSLLAAASAERRGGRAALVAAGLAMHLTASRPETKGLLTRYVNAAHEALAKSPQLAEFESETDAYRELQSHVPAGDSMVTAAYESFRFDFKRNPIYALDVLGGMGPRPGWPTRKGPEALGAYLKDAGVKYVAWVDFNSAHEFYGRAHWAPFAMGSERSYLQGEAVIQLDAEDAIEKLSAMRHVVYRGHGMTVFEVAARE